MDGRTPPLQVPGIGLLPQKLVQRFRKFPPSVPQYRKRENRLAGRGSGVYVVKNPFQRTPLG